MKENIITGTITDTETGETSDITPFHWFPNGAELKAIVKILCVSSHCDEGNDIKDVSIDCLALDCDGFVFKLDLYFLIKGLDEEQKIISDLTEGKIMVASGCYNVSTEEGFSITLTDPEYYPLPSEYSLEEVEEVFRFNNRDNKNRLT